MSEHFNIVGWLAKRPSHVQRRELLEYVFRKFEDFVGHPSDILILNTKDGTEKEQAWETGSTLLDHTLTADELLFVYGDSEGAMVGERPSICFEESARRATITISLPMASHDGRRGMVEDLCVRLCSALCSRFAQSIVVGGLEAELPGDAGGIREIVGSIDTTMVELVAVPASNSVQLRGFESAGNKDGVSIFRRTAAAIGH